MILKIVNGRLDLLSDSGGRIRTIAQSNVIDAALSDDEKSILITYSNGRTDLCNDSGGRKSTVAESNAVKAIFHKSDILITLKNGDMELRNQNCGKIRSF
ncbi:hypothetical protein [Capnocytophaga sputigena]